MADTAFFADLAAALARELALQAGDGEEWNLSAWRTALASRLPREATGNEPEIRIMVFYGCGQNRLTVERLVNVAWIKGARDGVERASRREVLCAYAALRGGTRQ